MVKSSLFFIMLLGFGYVKAQSIVWQSTFTEGWSIEQFNSLVILPDESILATGFVYGNVNGQWLSKRRLYKLDSLGNALWHKEVAIDSLNSSAFGFIKQVPNDSNFYVSGYSQQPGKNHNFLAKITPNGDTIWTRKYTYPAFYGTISAMTVLKDQSIVTCGYVALNNDENVIARRVDSLGNTLWENIYQMPGAQRGSGLTEMLDGSLIIAGSTDGDNLIMRIGFDGRLIEDTIYSPLNGDFRRVGVSSNPFNELYSNGGYMDSGTPLGESCKLSDFVLNYQVMFDPFATDFKINSAFNIVIERISLTPSNTGVSLFSDTTELSTFIFPNPENAIREINSMEFLGNDEMIVSGTYTLSSNNDYWLAKISGVGEEWIPDRCAYQPPRAGFEYEYNYPILTLRDTSTGGLKYLDTVYTWEWSTSVGQSGTMDSAQIFFDTAITKTINVQLVISNWYGCTDTVNKTLIFDPNGISEEKPLEVKIYPNPVNTILYIKHNGTESGSIKLYDLRGVLRQTSRFEGATHQIVLSSLPAGMYVIHLQIGSHFETRKLVKY